PLGFNLGGFYANQDILISDLGLGFNSPAQPVSFIQFAGAEATLTNVNVRTDLWLFPFLNVYGMVGTGNGHTTVHISAPVQFTTTADFKGTNAGIGLTGAFGFRRNFVVVDFNHQWGFSSLLDNPVLVNVLSMRLGKAFRVGQRLGGGLDTTVVNYTLNKKVADPWNLLIGGTYDVGRHWGLRGEVGFIGRVSFLLMGNYRITL